jgi:hypothetical protein
VHSRTTAFFSYRLQEFPTEPNLDNATAMRQIIVPFWNPRAVARYCLWILDREQLDAELAPGR